MLLLLLLAGISWGEAHESHPSKGLVTSPPPASTELVFAQVLYLKRIKPIFERSCFDCHSARTQYPWYHSIPGIQQWIDRDVREGREHLDFTGDYPFRSHATPAEDLTAINVEVHDGGMPPLLYRFAHPGVTLSEEQKHQIYDWVEVTRKALPPGAK